MLVQAGEKLHIVTRRAFESEPRRHFVGRVVGGTDSTVRVEVHAFVFNMMGRGEFVRRPERRTRIFSLVDANLVINVIPADVELDNVAYTLTADQRLVVTDGAGWQLDINEFGVQR